MSRPEVTGRRSAVRLVTLRDIFPGVNRSTLWRWRKANKFGPPDRVINGREYYREDKFASDDAAQQHEAASAAKAEA